MTEGSNQGLFVIVAIVIFGIFVSMVYLLFGDNLKPALSSIFKDSFENVNNIMGIDSYDSWVKKLENKGYVVATDSDFSGDRDGEFKYIGKAKKVIIPKVIKGVNITKTTDMFSNMYRVEFAVAMKNPNVTDMSKMFRYNQVQSLDVSNLFTENVTNMSNMFQDSTPKSLNLSSFDTSNVTNMTYMFFRSSAKSLDLSSFNTSNVTNMSYMFQHSNATSLDLSNFDTSKVTNMFLMFADTEVASLDLSSFNTSKVTDMGCMFYNAKATSLDLSSFDTSNVTDMAQMFQYSQATELDLSSFDTSKVRDRHWMFDGSSAIIGYAKTLADATKFNTSSRKPDTLNFVVKQQ